MTTGTCGIRFEQVFGVPFRSSQYHKIRTLWIEGCTDVQRQAGRDAMYSERGLWSAWHKMNVAKARNALKERRRSRPVQMVDLS